MRWHPQDWQKVGLCVQAQINILYGVLIPNHPQISYSNSIETKFGDLGMGQFLHDHQNQAMNIHFASYLCEKSGCRDFDPSP